MIDPKNKALSLVDEFKKFALKGNVIDMAVGVIIGTAFGKVIESLVKHVFMPLINLLPFKADNFDEVVIPVYDDKVIPIGKFITDMVAFLIVALVLFIFMVKVLGYIMRSKKEEAPPAPPPPTKDQELLAEIRDLLKQRQG